MKTNEFTYKVMNLNTAQLEIPRETYQRELSPDRVRRIVKAFDERIANEPKVSYRGGHYYVFDGQHTIAARKLRNDNQDLKWSCGKDILLTRLWLLSRRPLRPAPPCTTACGKQCPYSRAPDRQYLIISKARRPANQTECPFGSE